MDSLLTNVVLERAIISSVNKIQISSSEHVPTTIQFDKHRKSIEDNKVADTQPNHSDVKNSDSTCTVTSKQSLVQSSSCHAMPLNTVYMPDGKVLSHSDSFPTSGAGHNINPYYNENYMNTEHTYPQANYRPSMPKSNSEFSNFSIESLKFEPPLDYDILEVPGEKEALYGTSPDTNRTVDLSRISGRQINRDKIQDSLSRLQSDALGAIYSIDNLNEDSEQWNSKLIELRHEIQKRSTELQASVKLQERHALAKLDDLIVDTNPFESIEIQKSCVHNRLKVILSMIDFTRLLLDHAQTDEVDDFVSLLNNRTKKMETQNVTRNQCNIDFKVPIESKDTMMTEIFGSLTAESNLDNNDIKDLDNGANIVRNALTEHSLETQRDNNVEGSNSKNSSQFPSAVGKVPKQPLQRQNSAPGVHYEVKLRKMKQPHGGFSNESNESYSALEIQNPSLNRSKTEDSSIRPSIQNFEVENELEPKSPLLKDDTEAYKSSNSDQKNGSDEETFTSVTTLIIGGGNSDTAVECKAPHQDMKSSKQTNDLGTERSKSELETIPHLPEPLQNMNIADESPKLQRNVSEDASRHRRSCRLRQRMNRRHTEGSINYDWEGSNKHERRDGASDRHRLRFLNDEILKTKHMMDICRKQMSGAHTSSVNPMSTVLTNQEPRSSISTMSPLSVSAESSARERIEQFKKSVRRKSGQWYSLDRK